MSNKEGAPRNTGVNVERSPDGPEAGRNFLHDAMQAAGETIGEFVRLPVRWDMDSVVAKLAQINGIMLIGLCARSALMQRYNELNSPAQQQTVEYLLLTTAALGSVSALMGAGMQRKTRKIAESFDQ